MYSWVGGVEIVWNGSEYGLTYYSDDEIYFARTACNCGTDTDADGSSVCQDCDDDNAGVWPRAPQLCDGLNNDCNTPAWPSLIGTNEVDGDGDGLTACEGDCNDGDPFALPGAPESCDGYDNNCDGALDHAPECNGECATAELIGVPEQITSSPSWTPNQSNAAWSGAAYGLVSSLRQPGTQFFVFDEAGHPISEFLLTTQPSDSSSVVWMGTEFGVLYQDSLNHGYQLYFARFDSSGQQVAPEHPVMDPMRCNDLDAAWSGTDLGFVFVNNGRIYFGSLAADGAPIGNPQPLHLGQEFGSSDSLALVWNGTSYGVAWSTYLDGDYAIFFAELDSAGHLLGSAHQVTNSAAWSGNPTITWNGAGYGVAWEDQRDGNREVYFVRLDSFGSQLGNVTRITDDSATSSEPRLTWNGTEYGLLWASNSNLQLLRVDSFGSPIEGVMVVASPARSRSTLLWSGADYGIVWERDASDHAVMFSRLGCNCVDQDLDGISRCNDCDDTNDDVFPGADEVCNNIDDNCNGLIDEDDLGEDTDGDGFHNVCDNCPLDHNPLQSDIDADSEGDLCDLDDGLIYISFASNAQVDWQQESGYSAWNAYQGDLSVLMTTGAYTQLPGSNDLAGRECALGSPFWQGVGDPDAGEVAFFLATGVNAGNESNLGTDSTGTPRPNAHPCA